MADKIPIAYASKCGATGKVGEAGDSRNRDAICTWAGEVVLLLVSAK